MSIVDEIVKTEEFLSDNNDLTTDQKIDLLEMKMQECALVDCPVKHTFADGMYIREIFMPSGTLITSLVHKTKHPYFVLKGKVSVYSENFGEQTIEAPFNGMTTPNTRRVLYIHQDCVWITCHSTSIKPEGDSEEDIQKAVDLIGEEILEKRENELLGSYLKNNKIVEKL